jgi:hypothetical protein
MSASLRRQHSPRTVLIRMAADQARADRIRALKEEHPELTWARIADDVGVKERSAIEWQSTGGISYDNAIKLARVFDVDTEWLFRGKGETPSTASPWTGSSTGIKSQPPREPTSRSSSRRFRKTAGGSVPCSNS